MHRMVTPEARAEAERRRAELAVAPVIESRTRHGRSVAVVVHCTHDVPWTTCTLCSTPRAR